MLNLAGIYRVYPCGVKPFKPKWDLSLRELRLFPTFFCIYGQDNLSDVLATFHEPVRIDSLIEGQNGIDNGPDFTVF